MLLPLARQSFLPELVHLVQQEVGRIVEERLLFI